MLAIVARSASGRSRQSPARRTRRTCRPRPCSRSISVTVSTRSVAVVPSRQLAGQPEADDLRDQHRHRLAEHRRLGLDPADAPAEHAQAVDHRGVRVGAQADVRDTPEPSPLHRRPAARYSRLTWCMMPVPGGTTSKLPQRPLAPAQEAVALARCARTRARRCARTRRACRTVGHHRVVDHQLGRDERVDRSRVAAERGHGVAHRGQVDERGYAVGVVQEHPRSG